MVPATPGADPRRGARPLHGPLCTCADDGSLRNLAPLSESGELLPVGTSCRSATGCYPSFTRMDPAGASRPADRVQSAPSNSWGYTGYIPRASAPGTFPAQPPAGLPPVGNGALAPHPLLSLGALDPRW